MLTNPYKELYYWLEEEELDIEAFIENIANINKMIEQKDAFIQKKLSHEEILKILYEGKNSFFTLFSFKSKQEDIIGYEKEKKEVSVNLINSY